MAQWGKRWLCTAVCVAVWFGITQAAPQTQPEERRLLTNVRQLIFAGRRAGEGYFSADGKRITFQH